MPLMDEFREEREALKHGTLKQRLQYFWDYYKWHTIGAVIALICIVSLARNILGAKESALSVAMLNCATDLFGGTGSFEQEYAEYAGIDLNEYKLLFDTNLRISMNAYDQDTVNTTQKLMVSIAAGDLDVMMGAGAPFAQYANNAVFYDLRNLLSEEQIAQYEPYFYYIDMSVVKELERLRSELQDPSGVTVPDPSEPEKMAEPVPVALYIDSRKLENYYYFQNASDGSSDGLAAGILLNTSKPDNALSLLDFLMQL